MAFLFPSALSHCSHSGQLLSPGNAPGDTYYALEGGGDEATVHGNEGTAHVGLWGREEGQGGGGEHRPGVRSAPHAVPPGPTWMSSSLELKWDMMTFSPSETRVREMPRRPLARSWLSAGKVFSRQPRIVFTRLKEGCSGPRNRFRASLDTSMMLAPASPVSAGPRVRGQHTRLSAPPMVPSPESQSAQTHGISSYPGEFPVSSRGPGPPLGLLLPAPGETEAGHHPGRANSCSQGLPSAWYFPTASPDP